MIIEELRAIGEREKGGISPACEIKTSLLRALCPEQLQMNLAVPKMGEALTSFFTCDIRNRKPMFYATGLKRDSRDGVLGDPLWRRR